MSYVLDTLLKNFQSEDSKKRGLEIGEDYINLANETPSKKQKLTGGKHSTSK